MHAKKLTALILSILMVTSMAVTPVSAAETIDVPAETTDEIAAQAQLAVLPASSGDYETYTWEDYEYKLDTSVDEITITKYNGSANELVVPEKIEGYPVVAIGYNAFRENRKLNVVTLPKTLTTIEREVFRGCDRLETVDIPDSVESIGSAAFYGCSKLGEFDYPKSWKTTDSWGEGRILEGCEKITEITIPDGVTLIPRYAFDNCSNITKVVMPSSVKKIDVRAFGYNDNLTEVVFSDNITEIESDAFLHCHNLKITALPSALVTIGTRAFEECNGIKELTFTTKKLTNIGYCAFYNCDRLETADLPDSVETIESYAFANSDRLEYFHFPKNWENPNNEGRYRIFENCPNLLSVTVPEGVKTIPAYAFSYANCIEEITLPSTLKTIGRRAFEGCGSLKSITIPASVTSIENSAFENAGLTSVVVPEGIKTLSEGIFNDCSDLTSVTLPSTLQTIGYAAFRGCERLVSLEIPDSVEKFESEAFAGCIRLVNINYPQNLREVGSGIFRNCEALTQFAVPEGVKELPNSMFESATHMQKITLPSTLTKIGSNALRGTTALKKIDIPASVTSIGEGALRDSGITEITFPASLEAIPSNMFNECEKLTTVHLAEGLKTIGYAAFNECDRLETIDVPDSVERIESYAFANCRRLSSFHYPKNWENINDETFYCIFQNCEKLTNITVTEGVKTIPAYAFKDSNYIQNVTLPKSLTAIGRSAFENCSALENVTFPANVTTIGDSAFEGCASFTKVVLPSKLKELSYEAFRGCEKLVEVEFPAGLTTVGGNAFYYCTKLRAAELPDSVETIGGGAFRDCVNLTSFHYPASLENIENGWDGILQNCEALTTLNVPEGVKAIPNDTFRNCNCLVTVTLPSTLTSIGENAFAYCDALSEITIPKSVTKIASNAFYSCPLLTVYCAKYFKPVIDFIDGNVNVVSNDDTRRDTTKLLDSSISTYSLISGSKITVNCSYTMKSSVFNNASDMSVRFYIPYGAEVTDDSIYIDRELCTNFYSDTYHLEIPVTKRSGKISFTLNTDKDCRLQSYALLTYRLGSSYDYDYDIIDIVNEDYEIITLNAQDYISTGTLPISGMAPADKEVSVYVDGSLFRSITANKAGIYSDTLELGYLEEGAQVLVKVETLNKDGEPISAQQLVKYSAFAPELTGFTMQYNGNTYNMLAGVKHNVVFVLEQPHKPTPFKFSVKYKNADSIEKVYVTSTRNQITKKILATYDSTTGSFVAEGYFDPSNHDYVPGKIGIAYLEKHKVTTPTIKSIKKPYNVDCLPDALKTASSELTESSENFKKVTIKTTDDDTVIYTYERLTPDAFTAEYEATHSTAAAGKTLTDKLEAYGFDKNTDGGVTIYADFDKNASENQTILYTYNTSKKYVEKETIEFGTKSVRKINLLRRTEDVIAYMNNWGLNYLSTDKTEYINYNGYIIDYNAAKAEIMSSTLSTTAKTTRLEKLNELRRLAIELTASKLIGAYLSVVADYSFSDYPPMATAIFVIDLGKFFTGSTNDNTGGYIVTPGTPDEPDDSDNNNNNNNNNGGNGGKESDDEPDDSSDSNNSDNDTSDNDTSDNDDDDDNGDNDNGDGDNNNDDGNGSFSEYSSLTISFSQNLLNFSIDPSGYVYAGVTSNRVAGATVTAYWIPFDEADESYWDAPNEAAQEKWDSTQYSQINPLTTDDYGNYAWDVPEGWWKVVVEKEGYEVAASDWMKVPPPQTEVNIGLKSQAVPKALTVETSDNAVSVTFDEYIDPTTITNVKFTDAEGNEVKYSVDYSRRELDANNKAFAKKFVFTFTDSTPATVKLEVPSTVTSYCGVSTQPVSKNLVMFVPAADSDTESEVDTASETETETDTASETETETDTASETETETDSETETETDTASETETETDTASDTETGTDTPDQPTKAVGDIDGDGIITSADALAILIDSVASDVPAEIFAVADVDGDGFITSADALAVLVYSVNPASSDVIGKPRA